MKPRQINKELIQNTFCNVSIWGKWKYMSLFLFPFSFPLEYAFACSISLTLLEIKQKVLYWSKTTIKSDQISILVTTF